MPEKLRAEIKDIAQGQIRELLKNYGKVDLLWPDGGMAGFTAEEARKLQPGVIVGRGSEYASPEGWAMLKPEFVNEANRRGYPWELCTIAHGGSWHWSEKAEEHGTSAATLLIQLARVRARRQLPGEYRTAT
jgi:alpha-L-fucosidase